jgi:hypothetical protein
MRPAREPALGSLKMQFRNEPQLFPRTKRTFLLVDWLLEKVNGLFLTLVRRTTVVPDFFLITTFFFLDEKIEKMPSLFGLILTAAPAPTDIASDIAATIAAAISDLNMKTSGLVLREHCYSQTTTQFKIKRLRFRKIKPDVEFPQLL